MRTLSRAVPLFALVLAPLAACGEGDAVSQDDLSPAAVVRQAASSVQTSSVRYSLDVTQGPSPMSGEGEYAAGATPAGRIVFTGGEEMFGDATVEMIAVGSDTWMKTSIPDSGGPEQAAAAMFGAPGKWTKFPAELDDDEALVSEDFDIRTQLQQLVAAADVREVGEEEIEGVDTRRYSGTVSAAAVAASSDIPEEVRDELVDTLNDNKGDTAAFEAWVDDDLQIRRYIETGTDGDGAYTATVTFRDFGEDIVITPPAAADVFEFPDFSDPKAMKEFEKQMAKQFEEQFGEDWETEMAKDFPTGGGFSPKDFEAMMKDLEPTG